MHCRNRRVQKIRGVGLTALTVFLKKNAEGAEIVAPSIKR